MQVFPTINKLIRQKWINQSTQPATNKSKYPPHLSVGHIPPSINKNNHPTQSPNQQVVSQSANRDVPPSTNQSRHTPLSSIFPFFSRSFSGKFDRKARDQEIKLLDEFPWNSPCILPISCTLRHSFHEQAVAVSQQQKIQFLPPALWSFCTWDLIVLFTNVLQTLTLRLLSCLSYTWL